MKVRIFNRELAEWPAMPGNVPRLESRAADSVVPTAGVWCRQQARRFGLACTLPILLGALTACATGGPGDKGLQVAARTGASANSVWGIFVGVSQYRNPGLSLLFAAADAQALHDLFRRQLGPGLPADHLRLLVDAEATRGNVLATLNEVTRRAFPGDLLILFLSLHGMVDDPGLDLYFLTHDADPNLLLASAVGSQEIVKLLASSQAQRMVVIVDSCHAGGLGVSGPLLALKSLDAGETNRLLRKLGEMQPGMAVITSSSAAEKGREGAEYCGGHGAFTCALLQGLQGRGDGNGNGLVELRELFDYTYTSVKLSTDGRQHPGISGTFDNALPLSVVASQPAPPQRRPGAGRVGAAGAPVVTSNCAITITQDRGGRK